MALIGRVLGALQQRSHQRRNDTPEPVLSTHLAFSSEERLVFKRIERRRELRRKADVRQALVAAE